MKVKHIITGFGIILGGLVAVNGASAVVTYRSKSDVQFTFSSMLSLTVDDDFVISSLMPGQSDKSNQVTATVATNNSAGYELSATVGNSTTYDTTALTGTVGSTHPTISMISGSSLTSGTWGLTLDNGITYKALSRSADTILNKTTDKSGTGATGYEGGATTNMKIGAYAAANQAPTEYRNVINFKLVSNVLTHTITLAPGDNVATVTLGSGSASSTSTSNTYGEGDSVAIAATCASGYTFTGWSLEDDFGTITSLTTNPTTYTVGLGNATIRAYCLGTS